MYEELRDLSGKAAQEIDFKAVVDSLVDGVYITDGNGITLYVNEAFCRHTGIKPAQIIGRSVSEIEREGVLFRHSIAADVIRMRRPVNGTGFIRVHNGKSVHGYASGTPIFDGEGRIRFVIVSVFDTEKLKNRFNEFRDAQREDNAIQILENLEDKSLNPMIGSDPVINDIRRTITRAAPTDVTVLITGESGVGKEVVADRIYSMSRRVGKPYVKVNCTAIPANLLESELFGYVKGAFTGASSSGKAGLFELADGGTILLDEIGDLPIEMQTKLLRVLQNKEIMRIGATKPISLDVRIIAATNANLKAKIQEGSFREDLFYRLSVVPIHVPPIRERRGDIVSLAKYFFNIYCERHNRSLILPDSILSSFVEYDWPGNTRELQNVLEYMVVVSDDDGLNDELLSELIHIDPGRVFRPATNGLTAAVEEYEREIIEQAILRCGGVRKAAAYLKVDPSTVSRKARRYNINVI